MKTLFSRLRGLTLGRDERLMRSSLSNWGLKRIYGTAVSSPQKYLAASQLLARQAKGTIALRELPAELQEIVHYNQTSGAFSASFKLARRTQEELSLQYLLLSSEEQEFTAEIIGKQVLRGEFDRLMVSLLPSDLISRVARQLGTLSSEQELEQLAMTIGDGCPFPWGQCFHSMTGETRERFVKLVYERYLSDEFGPRQVIIIIVSCEFAAARPVMQRDWDNNFGPISEQEDKYAPLVIAAIRMLSARRLTPEQVMELFPRLLITYLSHEIQLQRLEGFDPPSLVTRPH